MAMTGRELLAASEALRGAFSPEEFDQLLVFHLDRRREDYAGPGNFRTVVFQVLTAAEREGWTPRLLAAARESNPTNAALMKAAEALQLAPVRANAGDALERLLGRQPTFVDISAWRERLGRLEGQVGRVEITVPRGVVRGTAFLVGPDTCITNHHVLERVIAGTAAPADVVVRFDYKRSGDGEVLNTGTEHRLAERDWLVDASPPSPVDSMVDPGRQLPGDEELDYALFRLAGEPGSEPVGGAASMPAPPRRGWLDTTIGADAGGADGTLFVLQHPSGEPLKLAFGPVVGLNGNGTRLRHLVDTERGSSGSPCFNSKLELVALHHAGDPDFSVGHRPEYNEAIPVSAVERLLARRDLGSSAFVPGGSR